MKLNNTKGLPGANTCQQEKWEREAERRCSHGWVGHVLIEVPFGPYPDRTEKGTMFQTEGKAHTKAWVSE